MDDENLMIGDMYSDAAHVYLASGDYIDDVLASLDELHAQKLVKNGGLFASVVGGLAGLNFISTLNPESIIFFDVNSYCLDWARLVIELIKISDTRTAFIQTYFCRSVESLPTVETEPAFIEQKPDLAIWQTVQDRLPNHLKKAHRDYTGQFLIAKPIHLSHNGVSLSFFHTPWQKNSKHINVCYNPLEPHCDLSRSLYLGAGWLESDESYQATRTALLRANLDFVTNRLSDLNLLGDYESVYTYISNINGYCPADWLAAVFGWKMALLNEPITRRFIAISAFDGVLDLANDRVSKMGLHRSSSKAQQEIYTGPHFTALKTLVSMITGKTICEVTHTVPFGFHEIPRDNLSLEDFMDGENSYDLVIFHTLLAAGICRDALADGLRKAWSTAKRIILFDHNPLCPEFKKGEIAIEGGPPPHQWLTATEGLALLKQCCPEGQYTTAFSSGHSHPERNWFAIADKESASIDQKIADQNQIDWMHAQERHQTNTQLLELLLQLWKKLLETNQIEQALLVAIEAKLLAPQNLSALVAHATCWYLLGDEARFKTCVTHIQEVSDGNVPPLLQNMLNNISK